MALQRDIDKVRAELIDSDDGFLGLTDGTSYLDDGDTISDVIVAESFEQAAELTVGYTFVYVVGHGYADSKGVPHTKMNFEGQWVGKTRTFWRAKFEGQGINCRAVYSCGEQLLYLGNYGRGTHRRPSVMESMARDIRNYLKN